MALLALPPVGLHQPRLNVGGVERGVVELCGHLRSGKGYIPIVASSGGKLVPKLVAGGVLHLVCVPFTIETMLVIPLSFHIHISFLTMTFQEHKCLGSKNPWNIFVAAPLFLSRCCIQRR